MAIGYPDFYSFTILEQYNVIQVTFDLINPIPANAETTIFEITGKGKLYRFTSLLLNYAQGDNPQIKCYIDGTLVHWENFGSSLDMIKENVESYRFNYINEQADDSFILIEHRGDIVFFESIKYTILTGVGETGILGSTLEYYEPNPQIIYAPL